MQFDQSTKDRFKNEAQDTFETLKNKACDYQDTVTDYIKDNPYKSIGMALLAGFFINKMM